jgi:protocatechuate 3,4-dioxygenase beta subunit
MILRALLTLGVLLLALAGWAQETCAPTRADMEGPFYKPGAPPREATGKGFSVTGAVKSAGSCAALPGARVEWWQANPRGEYDDAHRGSLVARESGRYQIETNVPPPYSGRPSHIHFKASAPGHRALTTQLYPRAGQTAVTFDLVLLKE